MSFQQKVTHTVSQMKTMSATVLQSRLLVSVLVFLSTILLLLFLNPPMAQELEPVDVDGDGDGAGEGRTRRSWTKIMVWASLAFVLALMLPSLCV